MGRKKSPKHFADGELPVAKQLECENQNIDEIMGNTGPKSGAFSTFNNEEYRRQLEDKSLVEIQKECIDHGIWPSKAQDVLVDTLMQAHARYIEQYQAKKLKPKATPRMTKEAKAFMEDTAINKIK